MYKEEIKNICSTNNHISSVWISAYMLEHMYVCVCLWLFELKAKCKNIQDKIIKRNNGTYYNRPPKRVLKTRQKGKNMQEKYLRPSVCSSKTHHVFLWADLGLRQKGGEREKTKFKKILLRLNKKSKKFQNSKTRKMTN